MNITIDSKNKTITVNELILVEDLMDWLNDNIHNINEYSIISKVEYYNQTQYPWISYTTPDACMPVREDNPYMVTSDHGMPCPPPSRTSTDTPISRPPITCRNR